jgi:hypothetical protein
MMELGCSYHRRFVDTTSRCRGASVAMSPRIAGSRDRPPGDSKPAASMTTGQPVETRLVRRENVGSADC